jgi:cytochrome c oxidase assembly protein subunit 15
VAGLRAGLIYNTWPLIDGGLVPAPSQLWFNEPWWRNFFENPLTVQFDHRMVAYALLAAAILHAVDAVRTLRRGAGGALALVGAVTLQAALGILTLLAQAPLGLALMHQAMAMIVLTIAVLHARALAAPEGARSADRSTDPADRLGAVARG